MKIIEIKNLKVSFNKKKILDGINLSINEGEIHAIMGPNGAGKSTLTHVICADPAYEVLEGAIFFKGENREDHGSRNDPGGQISIRKGAYRQGDYRFGRIGNLGLPGGVGEGDGEVRALPGWSRSASHRAPLAVHVPLQSLPRRGDYGSPERYRYRALGHRRKIFRRAGLPAVRGKGS